MAPHAEYEPTIYHNVDITNLKAKVVANHVELDQTPKPPVADDFMYDFKFNHALPTSDVLGIEVSPDCDAHKEAEAIVSQLSGVMRDGDAQAFTNMFIEYGEWLHMAYH
jgi:hypothetical protein